MFVGYLPDIIGKFKKNEVLTKVFGYLWEAIDEESEVFARISNLKAGETFEVYFDGRAKAIEHAYLTKTPQEAFYESHQAMVDFQMLINGKEIFFVSPHSLCEIKTPLDSTKDLIEYHKSPYTSSILLFRGNLAVFESIDVHAGGISVNTSELVQKVVVKIPKELIKLNF